MSNKRLIKVQLGKEVTAFTPVAATALLAELDDMPKVTLDGLSEVLMDQAGALNPGTVAVFDGAQTQIGWSGKATYQDLPFFMDSLFGVATPSGANPYVYAYAGPLATPPTLRRNTIEFGDAISGGPNYKIPGCLLNKFSLSTKPREAVNYSVEFLGGQLSTVTMAALSNRTQTPLHNSQASIYIDAWGGTLGATAVTATAQEFTLDYDAKRAMAWLSGDLFPTDHDEDIIACTLKGVFKFNATSKAYVDELIGNAIAQRQLRLKFTTGATAIAQFDLPALLTPKIDMWGERNTTIMVSIEAQAMYHATVANYAKVSITNAVSALP